MRERGIIRAKSCACARNAAVLRLFSVDDVGKEHLMATSSPVTKVAAAAACRAFQGDVPVRLDLAAVASVLRIPGPTAWASFTAFEPARAALNACLQHDLRQAAGVLAIVTLSVNSNIVHDLRSVLNVLHPHIAAHSKAGFITTCDPELVNDLRVELLLTGL